MLNEEVGTPTANERVPIGGQAVLMKVGGEQALAGGVDHHAILPGNGPALRQGYIRSALHLVDKADCARV